MTVHDPMTVAFELRRPWPVPMTEAEKSRVAEGYDVHRYRPALVTVWHVDPGSDGSDDSCDWSGWKWKWNARCDRQAEAMASWSKSGHDQRYFEHPDLPRVKLLPVHMDRDEPKENVVFHEVGQGDALALTLAAFGTIAWQLHRKELRGRALHEALRFGTGTEAARLFHATIDNDARVAAFKVLIHVYLRSLRPWWRSPRWHFWHWRIQVHCLQNFKRWTFSRCCKCGGRFTWGYSPVSSSWDSGGPRWFRSERGVSHLDCANTKSPGAKSGAPA